jgi:hypothetical protein
LPVSAKEESPVDERILFRGDEEPVFAPAGKLGLTVEGDRLKGREVSVGNRGSEQVK